MKHISEITTKLEIAAQNKAPVETPEMLHCPVHGPYPKQVIHGEELVLCKACLDEEREREEAKARAEYQEAKHKARLLKAGITPRFFSKNLDNYQVGHIEQKKALNAVREYAASFDQALELGRCLILLGAPGTGKTHLAAGLAAALLAQGRNVRMLSAYDAIQEIKDTWGQGAGMSEAEAIRQLGNYDLLILDEVGVQFGTDTEKLLLFRIINRRYEHMRPMVLISNERREEFVAYVGERAYDRLRENGGMVVPFSWPSHRGGKQ